MPFEIKPNDNKVLVPIESEIIKNQPDTLVSTYLDQGNENTLTDCESTQLLCMLLCVTIVDITS